MAIAVRGVPLLVAVSALLLPVLAQAQTAVCSNTPGAGERIECTEADTSTNNIDIDAAGIDIDTTDNHGVNGLHEGTGDIDIAVRGRAGMDGETVRSTIDVTGGTSFHYAGIHAHHQGTGSVDVSIRSTDIVNQQTVGSGVRVQHDGEGRVLLLIDENTSIDAYHRGVSGIHSGDGDLEIRVQGGSTIVTRGDGLWGGVYALQEGTGETSDTIIVVKDSTVTTMGKSALAVWGTRSGGAGTARVEVRDSTITVMGDSAHGILGSHTSDGDVYVNLENVAVTTGGLLAHAVAGWHQKTAVPEDEGHDVTIRIRDSIIRTERAEADPQTRFTFSVGILGQNFSVGGLDIDVSGGEVTTKGVYSYGIHGRHTGVGDIAITTRDGHAIATTGANGHGIVAENRNASDPRSITIAVGGPIDASGANADGVRVGSVSGGMAQRMAALGEDGYRRQTVTVNGPVRGNAAGVFLAGGGRIVIGPKGTLSATSGIAILATGDTPGADPANDPPIKPKLYVDMDLDGRQLAEVIHDDWIINDGGETTIAVNGVVLHDGATGSTGRRATNGVWDVWVREEGVTVTDRTGATPADWTITEPAAGVIADRDFSAPDFPEMPMLMEEYAPRSAVYESLPGILFRLDAQELSGGNLAQSGSPMSARFSGGGGSFEPDHATVGAGYNFNRFSAEAGLNIPLDENLMGSISVRGIRGNTNVDAPTGGGGVDADGIGVAVGVSYTEADAYYARGRFSLSRYDLDLSSDMRGSLKKGLDAHSHVLDLEAGRRVATHRGVDLTPRLWVRHSRVDVDDFTDTVGSRVSVGDETRFVGGLGVIAAGRHTAGNGELFLRGSVDLERTFSGATTSVDVSGEKLSTKATETRLLLGLGGIYRRGSFSARAGVSAGGLGSDDESYAGHVRFSWKH